MNIEMPNFTPRLETVSKERYKIKFLEDGYPGKDLGNRVAPHPIYGIYVIRDYLFQYKKTGDTKYQEAAIRVADAAIQRMNIFKNSLVFWYKRESVFNSTSKDYYSGLTQAYYAEVLAKMYASTNMKKYSEAARKVYHSLKIPVSEGGVLHNSLKGPSIQEYPMSPNGYVLNGWLSAISAVKNYAEILQDSDATIFWHENLQAVSKLLPLYDAPNFANSRYTLNGTTMIKIFSTSSNIELQKVSLNILGEGNYVLPVDSNKNYENFIVASSVVQKEEKVLTKRNTALLKVLLSRISYPKENEIFIKLVSPKAGTLHISIVRPKYLPTKIVEIRKYASYTLLEKVTIQEGVNIIKFKIPWDILDVIGTPTTFKQFGSKWYNVYHFIHINRLEEFYNITKDNGIYKYIEKWKGYVDLWDDISLYNGLEKRPYKKNS